MSPKILALWAIKTCLWMPVLSSGVFSHLLSSYLRLSHWAPDSREPTASQLEEGKLGRCLGLQFRSSALAFQRKPEEIHCKNTQWGTGSHNLQQKTTAVLTSFSQFFFKSQSTSSIISGEGLEEHRPPAAPGSFDASPQHAKQKADTDITFWELIELNTCKICGKIRQVNSVFPC